MNIRRIGRTVMAVVIGTSIALGAATPALADTRDDLTTADNELGTALTTFSDAMNRQNITAEEFTTAAQTFIAAAKPSVTEFRSVASADPDASVRGYANDFADETQRVVDSVTALQAVVSSSNQAGISKAVDDFQTSLNAYTKTADAYNSYIADHPLASGDPLYGLWMVLLIVSLVLLAGAILLAILARHQDGALPAKTLRNGRVRQLTLRSLRRNLVIFTAIFVAGAAIPFIQYWIMAHNGGDKYLILWYPLGVGAALSIITAVQYFVVLARVRKEGSAPLAGAPERSATGMALSAVMPAAAAAYAVQEAKAAKAAAASATNADAPTSPDTETPAG